MPPDDTYNLAPLTHNEVRDSVEIGFGSAFSLRLREAPPGKDVEIDGIEATAVDGKLVFLVGMRKSPKPVAPLRLERTWLRACAFLDPETLQCHIRNTEFYPDEYAECPGRNLVLEQKTECERVKRYHGGERLFDDAIPDDLRDLLLDPRTLDAKLLIRPEPGRLVETTDHLKHRGLAPEDCAELVGVVVGSYPDSTEVDGDRDSQAYAKTLESESWTGEAIATWDVVAGCLGSATGDASDPDEAEVARGALETSGWDTVRDDG